MRTFKEFLAEGKHMFPQEPTGAVVKGPLKLSVKHTSAYGDHHYDAYHGRKRVGSVSTTEQDPRHGKFSIFKSETHPDYRKMGVMKHLYTHVEKTTGKQLHPASALSDDGHAFWSKFRPEAVKDDLRNHRSKLLGKEVNHQRHGKGQIYSVGSNVAMAKREDGQTFPMFRDELKAHGHLSAEE